MSARDYLIDHRGYDWGSLLSDWGWLLPESFTLWLMNRFGDLFIVLDDGSVHMLDVGGGTFKKVAESREDFLEKIDDPGVGNNWLMIPLVDDLVQHGVRLREGQCYTYKQPPIMGGDYTVENTAVVKIPEHFRIYGSIHRQLKDFPDGTEVRIEIEPQGQTNC